MNVGSPPQSLGTACSLPCHTHILHPRVPSTAQLWIALSHPLNDWLCDLGQATSSVTSLAALSCCDSESLFEECLPPPRGYLACGSSPSSPPIITPLPSFVLHPTPYLEQNSRVSCGHQRDRGFLCGARSEGGVGGGGGSSDASPSSVVLPPLRRLGTVCYPGAGMYPVFQMASVQSYPGCVLFILLLQRWHPAVRHQLPSAHLPAESP